MIMLDATTALVTSPADLSDAVSSDNGVDLVYLDDDITLDSGITIYPGKATLVIDGTYNGVRHTLTDADSTASSQAIGIRAASSLQLTFQNIDMVGRNYYGFPYVYEGVNTDNVTVTYNKVIFTGKQVIFHQRGLTRFIDCDITIDGQPSSEYEEVGQVCKVEIDGHTTMRKTNTEDAVFWFYGNSARRPYLKILANADVTITTAHYFMFESYAPDYIIEPGASFTLNTNSGIGWDNGHTVASFLVGENASFRYTQTSNRGYATLNIDGALTVNDGANFYMQADFANNNPLIRFPGSGGSLNLNNPRSFALYNRGTSAARAFAFVASIPYVFVGNQVNRWDTPTAFPAAGTFEDQPQYKWNRPGYGPFRMEGRAGPSSTSVDSHNFTQGDLDQMSALDDLKLYEAVVFSEGNLPLSVRPVMIGTRPLTGKTAKKAKVRVSRSAIPPYPDSDADDDGNFSIPLADPVTFAEMISVASNTPFLITSLMVESRDAGELALLEAPEFIRFVPRPLDGFADVILRRQALGAYVVISDIREEKTEWTLWAKITGPLKTVENDILPDAVVYAREDGSLLTLGAVYQAVLTDGPYPDVDDVRITWAENRGVLARITVPIRSGRRYSTQLDWLLLPVGIQPEEGE